MKKELILLSLLASSFAFSQVGINTPNPLGSFHVDGNKNNPNNTIPNAGLQNDDFVVTSNGKVGIGTISPSEKLVVIDSTSTNQLSGIASFLANNRGSGLSIGSSGIKVIGTSNTGNFNLNAKRGGTLILQGDGTVSGNVGIYTNSPQGTLHVDGGKDNPLTGAPGPTESINDFVINNKGNVGIGTITPTDKLHVEGSVKITDGTQGNNKVLTSDATGKASWKDLPSSTDTNLYNADGTLSENRIVAQGTNRLTFHTAIQNGFAVGKPGVENIFSVDGDNRRVGIGTVAPTDKLHVEGSVKIADGTQGNNKVLTSDATGKASWKDLPSTTDTNLYNADGTLAGNRIVTQGANTLAFNSSTVNAFSLGNTLSADTRNNRLGLGTTVPTGVVDIVADNKGGGAANNFNFTGYGTSKEPAIILSSSNGTIAAPANLNNGDDIASIYFAPRANGVHNMINGSAILTKYRGDGTTVLTDLLLKTSGQDRLRIDENGNVGVGTSAPTDKLHVAGSVKIEDGTQGDNKVLTSDATGKASWKDLPSTTDTNLYNADGTLAGNRIVTQGANTLAFNSSRVNAFSLGNTLSADTRNNRIGLGTTAPTGVIDIVVDNKGGGAANNFNFRGYGTSKEPAILFSSSNGTEATPANLISGDDIGSIYFTPRANGTLTGGSAIQTKYRGDGTTGLTDLLLKTSGRDRLKIDENGNVGVGTSAPTDQLHVAGSVKIVDGTQGNNKVLTSDATGKASWKDLPSSADTNLYNANGTLTENRTVTQGNNKLAFNTTVANGFAVNKPGIGSILSVDGNNSRIGIGTSAPTEKLEINSGIANRSGLKFTNLKSGTPVTASGTATLGVDSSGNIVTVPGVTPDVPPISGRVVLTGGSMVVPTTAANYKVLSYTLPAAGTYLITYSIRGQANSGNQSPQAYAYAFINNGTYVVPNTEVLLYNVSADLDGGTGTGTLVQTVTGPTTYYVGVKATWKDCTVINSANGRSSVSYVKLN